MGTSNANNRRQIPSKLGIFTDAQQSIAPLKPDMGRIYFYRTAVVGAAIQPDVMLNDVKVGKAVPQGVYYVDKAPGNYVVKTSTEVKRTASFTLAPAQERYIRFDVNMGFFVGHVCPILMEEQKAKKEMFKCKLINPI